MAYSHSAISTYGTCPLKYKYTYIDKIEPLRRNIEGFLGSRVHETLEKLYKDKLFEKTNTIEDLINYYNHQWNTKMTDEIFVTKDYDQENYRKMGEKYIANYYNSHAPFDDGKTIALERRVFFPINEKFWLVGIIDRISQVNDCFEVHDYKTSLYLPTKKDIENDSQLSLYALALNHIYGITNIELVWHFLAFDKDIRLKKDSYDNIRDEIICKIEVIEKAKVSNSFSPKESALCPYCGYQPICPLFKHKFQLEEKTSEPAKNDGGKTLVDQLEKITEEINMLASEKADIEKRIIDYSIKDNLQYIYGSNKIANIKTYKNIQFNDKTKIHEAIKNTGLYDQYSRLDTIKLSNDLKNEILPKPLAEELHKLSEEKSVTRIYLRSKNSEK